MEDRLDRLGDGELVEADIYVSYLFMPYSWLCLFSRCVLHIVHVYKYTTFVSK